MTDREALQRRLLATFKVEAREHVEALSRGLLDLERAEAAGAATELVESAFREVHSLKGAARSVGALDIESVCQALESVFSALKRGKLQQSASLLDRLLEAQRFLEQLLTALEGGRLNSAAGVDAMISALSELLRADGLGKSEPLRAEPLRAEPLRAEPLRAEPRRTPDQSESAAVGDAHQPIESPATALPSGRSTSSPPSVFAQLAAAVRDLGLGAGAADSNVAAVHLNPPPRENAVGASRPEGLPPSLSQGTEQSTAAAASVVGSEERALSTPHAPTLQRPEAQPSPSRAEARVPGTAAPAPVETVRVATERLDQVRLLAEDLLMEKLSLSQHAADLARLAERLRESRRKALRLTTQLKSAGAASSEASAPLADRRFAERLADVLEHYRVLFEGVEHDIASLNASAGQIQRGLVGKSQGLLEKSRELLLLPCEWLFEPLRQVTRDLAREQGKSVVLELQGQDLELDRRILAGLRDPFLHIIRNCIDHGVESPAERARVGKSASALLQVQIGYVRAGRVAIRVSDDGRGIDLEQVKRAALKARVINPEELAVLTPESILQLVFKSDVSTSPWITDLSGRGLGLAIVRESVEKLGGAVDIESHWGKGTRLTLELPASLASFRAVVVGVAGHLFAIPSTGVRRVLRVQASELTTIENRSVLRLDSAAIGLVPLAKLFSLSAPAREQSQALHALLISVAGEEIAVGVDEIVEELDIPVKPLGEELQAVRIALGATLLGNGRVAPILDPAELLQSARGWLDSGGAVARTQAEGVERRASILVAEDSITSRTLLKGILESAGFLVTTAVDGADAFTKLRSEKFDLVVSDVDMPRLNGFGLTERIRADRDLAELPVVLVTSLDSREDRERGIAVGANAYIVKRSFEQSNLLAVIRRLI